MIINAGHLQQALRFANSLVTNCWTKTKYKPVIKLDRDKSALLLRVTGAYDLEVSIPVQYSAVDESQLLWTIDERSTFANFVRMVVGPVTATIKHKAEYAAQLHLADSSGQRMAFWLHSDGDLYQSSKLWELGALYGQQPSEFGKLLATVSKVTAEDDQSRPALSQVYWWPDSNHLLATNGYVGYSTMHDKALGLLNNRGLPRAVCAWLGRCASIEAGQITFYAEGVAYTTLTGLRARAYFSQEAATFRADSLFSLTVPGEQLATPFVRSLLLDRLRKFVNVGKATMLEIGAQPQPTGSATVYLIVHLTPGCTMTASYHDPSIEKPFALTVDPKYLLRSLLLIGDAGSRLMYDNPLRPLRLGDATTTFVACMPMHAPVAGGALDDTKKHRDSFLAALAAEVDSGEDQ